MERQREDAAAKYGTLLEQNNRNWARIKELEGVNEELKREFTAYATDVLELRNKMNGMRSDHRVELEKVAASVDAKKKAIRESFISQKNIIVKDYEGRLAALAAPEVLEPIFAYNRTTIPEEALGTSPKFTKVNRETIEDEDESDELSERGRELAAYKDLFI